MAISSTNRKAGPYLSDGEQLSYSFDFKVFIAQDLRIVTADTNGAETDLVLDTDYSVTLNEDQENDAGGTITLIEALTENYTLIITSNIELTQDLQLLNGGNFSPKVINNALDKIVIQLQQVNEKADRAVKSPITGEDDPDEVIAQLIQATTIAQNGTIKDWAYSESFAVISATRNANNVITSANIKWPDGVSGVFTTDTINATHNTIDAWHATYVGTTTKTVTQTAVTRNADGAVTAQPEITIS